MMRIYRWNKKTLDTTMIEMPFSPGKIIECDDPRDVWTTFYDVPDLAHQSSLDYLAGV